MSPAPSEAATRARLIDAKLRQSGWSPIVPFSAHQQTGLVAFTEYPTANGPADYALFHHGEPLQLGLHGVPPRAEGALIGGTRLGGEVRGADEQRQWEPEDA